MAKLQETEINIFYLDHDPVQCAMWHVDKHVVKMILESAQLLSTAHRLTDGKEYIGKTKTGRNAKRWLLENNFEFPHDRESVVYHATHVHHPSAVWCRATNTNYNWLYSLFIALMNEYTYRYGKNHSCGKLIPYLDHPPRNIAIAPFTEPTPAMPDEYKVPNDSVASYKNYYIGAKAYFASWKNRETPNWFK